MEYANNSLPGHSEQLLNKKQLAKRLGVSQRTIDNYKQRKVIPFYQPSSRMVRYDYKKVINALGAYEIKAISA